MRNLNSISYVVALLVIFAVLLLGAVIYAEEIELTLWTSQFPKGAVENLVNLFESKHPDIKIDFVEYPWNDAQWNLRLTTALAAGQLPDIIIAPQVAISWGLRGFVQTVTDLVGRDGIDMEIFTESSLGLSIFNDEVYAIPFTGSGVMLYYNERIIEEAGIGLDEPPKSWSELINYAEKTEKIRPDGGIERLGYVADYGGVTRLTLYMYGNGGGFFKNTSEGIVPILDDPKNVEALEWYVYTYNRVGGAEKAMAFVEGVGGEAQAGFYSGRVAMSAEEQGFSKDLELNAPDLEWGVWPHPTNDGVPYVTLAGIHQVMMGGNAESEKREASWEFIKFAAFDKEAQIQFLKDTYAIPLIPGIDPKELAEYNPALLLCLELLQGPTRPWNPNPLMPATLYTERSKATELALQGVKTPAEALKEANENIKRVWEQVLKDLEKQGITEIDLKVF